MQCERVKWTVGAEPETARLIAQKLGAKELGRWDNEFELQGQPVIIQPTQLGGCRLGVPYEVIDRVDAVVAAYEIGPCAYDLISLNAERYKRAMRPAPMGRAKVGMVTNRMFLRYGSYLGQVNIEG